MAVEPTGWRRGGGRVLVLLILPLAWNSVTYCDLDALRCKKETASGVVEVAGGEMSGAIGKRRDFVCDE